MSVVAHPAPATSPTRLLIGGRWRDGGSGTFRVTDPADGGLVAEVADGDVADGVAAMDAAAAALPAWSATTARARSEILHRAFTLMRERREPLADLIVAENGKARADALAEIDYAAEYFRWFAEEAVRALGTVSRAPAGDHRIVVQHRPIGVAVLVTPWNFPAAMATRKIGPALAAGCTVVLKPAPDTPLTALAVAEILAEAGVPDGVVNVVPTSDAPAVVAAMLDHPSARKLSFTGSTAVGKTLLAAAARSVLSCSMELGGNAAFVVLDDADLDAAVAGAIVAKMRNGGQACTAANRFVVHTAVAEAFTDRLVAAMGELTLGPGGAPGVHVGPLINAAAVEKVHDLVDDAVTRGARVRLGGDRVEGPGHFAPVTVLDQVPPDARLLRQEVFGPVAPIVVVDSEEEAIAVANATETGLTAYVYSGDQARAWRVAEQIEVGMVAVNRGLVSDPAAPFGGVRESGMGREGAHEGLLAYLEEQYLAIER